MNDKSGKGGRINYVDFLILDLISLAVSFVISYVVKFGDFGFIRSEAWMPLLYVVLLLNVVIGVFSNPYGGIFRRPYYEEIVRALLLTFYNLLASGIILYVFKIGTLFSRQMILTMYALYFIISLALKCLWKKLVLSKKIRIYNPRKTALLVVCSSEGEQDALHGAQAGDFDAYEVKGVSVVDDDARRIDDLVVYSLENGIEEVLVTVPPEKIGKSVFEQLIKNGIGIRFSIDSLLGFQAEDRELGSVGSHQTLNMGSYTFTPAQSVYLIFKRLADIIIGLIGVIFLLPLTAVIKLVYLVTGDSAKIIYTQSRVGKNGKPIRIYKYRTMVPDADGALAELLKDEKYRAQWEANQKLAEDPRITKAGRFLRKTSVDELPQLINVLKGEMSLVGPRPLVPGELEAHSGMKLYQQLRPGITGWWGCNGRSNIDYRERLELEYYYIRNVSAYLDFLCVLRTVLSVVKRDGAE